MQTPPPFLSFDPTVMKDAQCAETNEKSIFQFLFFELSWKFMENWGHLSTKMTITQKIKIWNFIFHSIQHCTHLSWKWEKNTGGVCISLLGQGRFLSCLIIDNMFLYAHYFCFSQNLVLMFFFLSNTAIMMSCNEKKMCRKTH